jgi:hypothetical protein
LAKRNAEVDRFSARPDPEAPRRLGTITPSTAHRMELPRRPVRWGYTRPRLIHPDPPPEPRHRAPTGNRNSTLRARRLARTGARGARSSTSAEPRRYGSSLRITVSADPAQERAAIEAARAALPAPLARRAKVHAEVDLLDVPPAAAYVDAVRATGAHPRDVAVGKRRLGGSGRRADRGDRGAALRVRGATGGVAAERSASRGPCRSVDVRAREQAPPASCAASTTETARRRSSRSRWTSCTLRATRGPAFSSACSIPVSCVRTWRSTP